MNLSGHNQRWRTAAILFLALFCTGGMCEGPTSEPTEDSAASTAAERLQQPRNIYDGNVIENLHELEADLQETVTDRSENIERRLGH